MTKRRESIKQRLRLGSRGSNTLLEEVEDGYVQIFIKKEHLEELQSILTIKRNSKDMSQAEMTSLCGILADCGILANKEN